MSINEEKIIRVQASLIHVLYPKHPQILGSGDNNWGSTIWKVELVHFGEVNYDGKRFNEISVVGEGFDEPVEFNKKYNIVAKEGFHEKYGVQYELITINEVIDFSKIENQKAFLKVFCTENQINEMYEIFDSPIEVIANHDIEGLTKVKGIGEYTARSIIARFEKNKDNSKAYIELEQYDLTPNLINKLINHYNSVAKTIEIVKERPYELVGVSGIGFKKADEIALKTGIGLKSIMRIKAFIKYCLNEQAQDGNSFLYSNELTMKIFNELGGKENIIEYYKDEEGNIVDNNVKKAIQELINEETIVLQDNENRSQRKIYLKKYYELEEQSF